MEEQAPCVVCGAADDDCAESTERDWDSCCCGCRHVLLTDPRATH